MSMSYSAVARGASRGRGGSTTGTAPASQPEPSQAPAKNPQHPPGKKAPPRPRRGKSATTSPSASATSPPKRSSGDQESMALDQMRQVSAYTIDSIVGGDDDDDVQSIPALGSISRQTTGFVQAPPGMRAPTPTDWGRAPTDLWGADTDLDPSSPGLPNGTFGGASSPGAQSPSQPHLAAPPRGPEAGLPGASTAAPTPATSGVYGPRGGMGHPPQGGMGSGLVRHPAVPPPFGSDEEAMGPRHETDELYRQAHNFPPPPPPRCPKESRRDRAGRWYYFAANWDITHQQAPPPRSPLELLDKAAIAVREAETQGRNGAQVRELWQPYLPYKGDQWLERSDFWFEHVQRTFPFPPMQEEQLGAPPALLERHCVM